MQFRKYTLSTYPMYPIFPGAIFLFVALVFVIVFVRQVSSFSVGEVLKALTVIIFFAAAGAFLLREEFRKLRTWMSR